MSNSYFRSDVWVKAANGGAIPGCQVYVLSQPANLPRTNTPTAPNPQIQVYADVNGLVPLSQPIFTDGFGHVDFYLSGGPYTLAVYLGGTLQNSYADQYPMGGGGGGTPGLTTQNHSWNAGMTYGIGCHPIVAAAGFEGITSGFPFAFIPENENQSPPTDTTLSELLTYASPCGPTASITAWSITSDVVTFTAVNSFSIGQYVFISGLSSGSFMNGSALKVISSSGTAFTAAVSHANTSQTENGKAFPIDLNSAGQYSPTAWSINNNVLQLTVTYAEIGLPIVLEKFSTGSFLNGQVVTVENTAGASITADYTSANDSAFEIGSYYANGVYQCEIVGWNIVSNVLTVYPASGYQEALTTTGTFELQGLSHGSYLNGVTFTIASFVNYELVFCPFTHANANATETGKAAIYLPYSVMFLNSAGTNALFTPGVLQLFSTRARLSTTTEGRVWIGVGDQQFLNEFAINAQYIGNVLATDTPSFTVIGFRFSPTNAGDTTWQCVVAETFISTSVVPDTSSHIFTITLNDDNIEFSIDNSLVATYQYAPPSQNTVMTDMIYCDNQNATGDYVGVAVAWEGWITSE